MSSGTTGEKSSQQTSYEPDAGIKQREAAGCPAMSSRLSLKGTAPELQL